MRVSSRLLLFRVTVAVTSAVWPLSAQQLVSNRLIYVNVSDPANRFVTGLAEEHFRVSENGAPGAITSFSGADTPISVAIVTAEPLLRRVLEGADELISARSLSEALRQLASSKNPRKTVILAVGAEAQGNQSAPGGIQVVRTDLSDLLKTVIAVRNQYVLGLASSQPSASILVAIRTARGLPVLRSRWR